MTQNLHMSAKRPTDPTPIGNLNTTPLIDVMLCLLVMMILSIPAQSHAVKIDLPLGAPSVEIRDHNLLQVTAAGVTMWNGAAINSTQLHSALTRLRNMDPAPELRIQPDPAARYVIVDSVLAQVRRTDVPALGFVGNENYAREF